MLRRTTCLAMGYCVRIDLTDNGRKFAYDGCGVQKVKRPPPGKRLKVIDHNLENEYSYTNKGPHGGHHDHHGDAKHDDHGHGKHSDHGHAKHDDHGHGHGHHEIFYPKQSRFSFNSLMPVPHTVLEDIPETKFVTSQRASTNSALTTTKEHNQIAQTNISELEKSAYKSKHPNFLAHKLPYTVFDQADLVVEDTRDWYQDYQLGKYKLENSNPNGPTKLKYPFSPKQ